MGTASGMGWETLPGLLRFAHRWCRVRASAPDGASVVPAMSSGNEKQTAGIGKGTPGPGRKPGIPNKLTRDVKAAIEQAFNDVGGVEYLKAQAAENPQAFLTLLGKILPKDVKLDLPENFSITIKA